MNGSCYARFLPPNYQKRFCNAPLRTIFLPNLLVTHKRGKKSCGTVRYKTIFGDFCCFEWCVTRTGATLILSRLFPLSSPHPSRSPSLLYFFSLKFFSLLFSSFSRFFPLLSSSSFQHTFFAWPSLPLFLSSFPLFRVSFPQP